MAQIASRVAELNGEGALSVFARAKELEKQGRSIIHLELGEPDFHPAAPVVDAFDTSGAGDVFAGVLAAGWTVDRDRALRRACAAGALATLVAGAGDCAPYADAIDEATLP